MYKIKLFEKYPEQSRQETLGLFAILAFFWIYQQSPKLNPALKTKTWIEKSWHQPISQKTYPSQRLDAEEKQAHPEVYEKLFKNRSVSYLNI